MSPSEHSALFPVLTTSRLVLRQLQDGDQSAVFELRSDPMVGRYIDRPLPQHIDEAAAFIQRIKKGYADNSAYYWALSLHSDPAFIGSICLWNFSHDRTIAEAGYELLPAYHGRGYMDEALKAICDYGFNTLKLTAIEAFTHRDNISSKNLLERNGFILCADRVDKDVATNVIYKKEHTSTR